MADRKHCDAVEGGGYHCRHAAKTIKVDGEVHSENVCCDCGERFIERSRPVWLNPASEHGPYDPRKHRVAEDDSLHSHSITDRQMRRDPRPGVPTWEGQV